MQAETVVHRAQGPERDGILSAAIQLGWRISELYAQVDDPGTPLDANEGILPSHQSLEHRDQLELQLRAAEGDARRAGIESGAGALRRLIPYAREAPGSTEAGAAFRDRTRDCHVELAKALWALDEAAGKAYELGNAIADTYSRIWRAYRAYPDSDPASEWGDVFHPARIERLKVLLDDLESRRSSAGVAVVKDHLDAWGDRVREHLEASDGTAPLRELPKPEAVRVLLRRQTVIWRQLTTGDKEPEAYLDSEARGELRGRMRRMVWRRARPWLLPLGLALFAIVVFFPQLLSWYERGIVGTGIASLVLAAAGALGITAASVLATVRTRAGQWSQLLWNRAVADEVRERTLELDGVIPPPAAEDLAAATRAIRLSARARGIVGSRHRAPAGHRPRTSV